MLDISRMFKESVIAKLKALPDNATQQQNQVFSGLWMQAVAGNLARRVDRAKNARFESGQAVYDFKPLLRQGGESLAHDDGFVDNFRGQWLRVIPGDAARAISLNGSVALRIKGHGDTEGRKKKKEELRKNPFTHSFLRLRRGDG